MTAVLLAVVAAVHQAGHAAVYRDLGIGRAVVMAGLRIPPRIVRPATDERPYPLVVTPWLVAWRVKPDITGDQADELTYRDAALFAAGGVIASLVLGCTLLAVWSFFTGALVPAFAWAAAAVAGWVARRWVAAVLVPGAGLVLLGTEVWALAGGLHISHGGGLAALLLVHSFLGAFYTAAVLSLTVALFTMLPLPMLDGGKMMELALKAWLGERAAAVYGWVSSWLIIAVIALAVLADVHGVLG